MIFSVGHLNDILSDIKMILYMYILFDITMSFWLISQWYFLSDISMTFCLISNRHFLFDIKMSFWPISQWYFLPDISMTYSVSPHVRIYYMVMILCFVRCHIPSTGVLTNHYTVKHKSHVESIQSYSQTRTTKGKFSEVQWILFVRSTRSFSCKQ